MQVKTADILIFEKLQHYIRLLLLTWSQSCSLQNTAKVHTVEGSSMNISGIRAPPPKAIRSLVFWTLVLWHPDSSSDSQWCGTQACASSAICCRLRNGKTVEKESWRWGAIPICIRSSNWVCGCASWNPKQGLVLSEEHIAQHFLEMVSILDTCPMCIEIHGLWWHSSMPAETRDQRSLILPSFYEPISTRQLSHCGDLEALF